MFFYKKKDRTETMSLFFRQLASMLNAGISVKEALEILSEENEDKHVKRLASDIHQFKEQGAGSVQAAKGYPDWFKNLLDHVLEKDKMHKDLSDMIFKIADDHETMEGLKSRFKSAMIYPATIVVIAIFVLSFVLIFVIPTFDEMFKSFGSHLPAPTLLALRFSKWASDLFGYVVLILLFFSMVMRYRKGLRDKFLMWIPGLNTILKTLTMIRFSRYLSMMMSLNMPLRKALDAAINVIPNRVYADRIKEAFHRVEGEPDLFDALKNTGFYSPMAVRILAAGKKSGSLANALQGLAQYYEKSKITSIEGVLRVFEIMVFLTVATLVGFLVIAMYLPIFMMAGAV